MTLAPFRSFAGPEGLLFPGTSISPRASARASVSPSSSRSASRPNQPFLRGAIPRDMSLSITPITEPGCWLATTAVSP